MSGLRIIVWGINYAPEKTGIGPFNAALCNYLQSEGHDVQMVTSFPYYPSWRKEPKDSARLYRTDLVDGVSVQRCWHYVPAKLAAWKRILHEGSFVASSLLRMLSMKRADVYVVVSPPLLLGAAAWLVSILKCAPFIFHVQDLQPDAAVGLGMLKPGMFTRLLYRLEALAYAKASRVSGISPEMIVSFRRKNIAAQKCIYFPNGVVIPKDTDTKARGLFRRQHGIAPEAFLAIYSGNLGIKQGLDILIRAGALLKNPNIHLVICGEGADRARLERLLAESRLTNVLMLPLQDSDNYRAMLTDSDLCLITQQSGSGKAFLPSKLLNILAMAKPVLAVADYDSALSQALFEGKFGVCVPPDSPEAAAKALDAIADDPSHLPKFGASGLSFVKQFEMDKVLADFTQTIVEVHRERLTPTQQSQTPSAVTDLTL